MKKITCSHDTDVPVEEWPVRPYSKSELARAYAPRMPGIILIAHWPDFIRIT